MSAQRVERLVFRAIVRAVVGVASAWLGLGCGELPDDLLVVAPPEFGRGTAAFEIVLGAAIDPASVAVALDGADVTPAFSAGPSGLRGTVEIASGDHRLVVRARLREAASPALEHSLDFTAPNGLPPLLRSEPADGATGVSSGDWIVG